MFDNECAPTSSSSAPAPSPDDDKGSNSNNNNYENADQYEKQYDNDNDIIDDNIADDYVNKYEKYYEDKYAGAAEGEAEKYEREYDGEGEGEEDNNPLSVPGNDETGGSNSEQQETSTFCKCLAAEKASGKSYAASQNDFSKCIDKANGNDAKHWERVAKKYEHKYGVKTGTQWGKIQITTTKAAAAEDDNDTPAVPATDNDDKDAPVTDKDDAEDAPVPATDDDNTDNTDNTDNVDKDETELLSLDEPDNRFGNAAIYITFIGASIMLFICAWFIKDGMKKWKLREYSTVDQSSSFESEADADRNGNPYGGGDDDWDDNYDSNYSRNDRNKGKKGKFSQWNQYSAV